VFAKLWIFMKESTINLKIRKSLKDLGKEFKISETSILNEFDAQAELFNILRKNLKKLKDIVHCQCTVENIGIRPDIMIFENIDFHIEKNKKDKFSIGDWTHNISSVIEIKHLLNGDSNTILNTIKQDFYKLRKYDVGDSYVVLLHHSSNSGTFKYVRNQINNFSKKKKNKNVYVFYCNRVSYFLIKNGKLIK